VVAPGFLLAFARAPRPGPCPSWGGVTQPDQHVCSICSVLRTRDRVAGAGGELEFYPPVAFRRAPAARKSASDDRFTAGARLRWYLSRRSALPAHFGRFPRSEADTDKSRASSSKAQTTGF
jgi:hypothetical protein